MSQNDSTIAASGANASAANTTPQAAHTAEPAIHRLAGCTLHTRIEDYAGDTLDLSLDYGDRWRAARRDNSDAYYYDFDADAAARLREVHHAVVSYAALLAQRDELRDVLDACLARLIVNAPDAEGEVSDWDSEVIDRARALLTKLEVA